MIPAPKSGILSPSEDVLQHVALGVAGRSELLAVGRQALARRGVLLEDRGPGQRAEAQGPWSPKWDPNSRRQCHIGFIHRNMEFINSNIVRLPDSGFQRMVTA